MHYGRFKPTTVLLKNGDVLIFSRDGVKAEIYKTKEKKFIMTKNSNKFLPKPSTFLLSSGKVLIMGCELINHKVQNSIEIFDPATNTFYKEKRFDTLVKYAQNINIFVNNDKIYIINGKKNLLYDLTSNSFKSLPTCIIPRIKPTVIYLNNGKFLILGGKSSSSKDSKYISRAEIYDTKTNKFLLGPISPEIDGKIKIVTLKNNNVLILSPNKAIIYDYKKNQFHSVENLIKQRNELEFSNLEYVVLKNGNVLIAGGSNNSYKQMSDTEIFDPNTEKFIVGPKLLYPRKNHQLTLLNNGNVLVIGGEEELNPLNIFNLFNTDVQLQKRAEIYIPSENN